MIKIKLITPKDWGGLSTLPDDLRNGLLQGLRDGLLLIQRTATKEYLSGPYPEKLTSKNEKLGLKAKLYGKAEFSNIAGEFARGEFGVNLPLAIVHEQTGFLGTKFPIFAKNLRKGMTFFWKRRNIWVHGAKYVHMPARPFLRPSVYGNIDNIRIMLDKMILRSYKKSISGGKP